MATPEHKLTGKSAGEGVQNSAEKKAAEPAEGKEAASEEWRVARGQGAGDATSTGEQSTSTAGGYKIHIPMYEGPLDLLLDLIKQQKMRSEEHTSELQSRLHLVCRLLLEKKKKITEYSSIMPRDYPPVKLLQKGV